MLRSIFTCKFQAKTQMLEEKIKNMELEQKNARLQETMRVWHISTVKSCQIIYFRNGSLTNKEWTTLPSF
jgi:hypothetical protein